MVSHFSSQKLSDFDFSFLIPKPESLAELDKKSAKPWRGSISVRNEYKHTVDIASSRTPNITTIPILLHEYSTFYNSSYILNIIILLPISIGTGVGVGGVRSKE